ncbi:LysR substrate-binding domain-containing protein [Phyllobacterium zundukense]|uniref:LysR substrate-binding domain-containing protein n=1 Tax=Phyllobacterium zundukense TaxID=1867719 RepID=A0ACD4CX59_9HYPH|nr:LysR substrate-binding domain-containing protein [Phyllobacterium zundukense]UXN58159.1 LysR substrate-binding domain-containing protein [Phyllobacterium zundukense]
MKRDLEIDLLRSFAAVAAHRNFTHAARAIGRTQSAVSLQIKRLEDIVEKRLFERNRQSVSITHVGEALLVYANRILAANDAALSHLHRPEAEGLVRIGAPDDYATFLLPPILAAIAKEYPRLQFEVTCDNASDLLPMLDQGQLDVVVATHRPNAVAGQIARYEQLHWVASPDYMDDPDAPLSLVLFPTGCVCREVALDTLKRIDRSWRIAYSTRSIELMEKAILESAAVSVMEASIVPASLKIIDGQIGLPPLPEVVISVHQSNTSEPHVSLVTDFLLEKLGRVEWREAS